MAGIGAEIDADDSENEEFHLPQRKHKVPRVWKDRSNPLDLMHRQDIRETYRFWPETIYSLLAKSR